MSTLYTHQDTNVRKTWFLMVMFFIMVIFLGWGMSWYFESPGILYFAVIFSTVMNVFSYWYSDRIVLSLHRARPVTRESHFDLWNVTENLAISAGLPMPRLFVIDDPAPNAFATGRNPEHGVVVVTTGLLGMMERSELEGVIGHELSHIGNRDTLVQTIVVVLVGFVALLSDLFIRMSFFGGGNRDRGNSGAIFVLIGIVLAILAPIAASLIQLAISRKREFLADASGALLTRYPDGLAGALEKIGAYSGSMKIQSNATAHLFISSPLGGKKKLGSGFRKLFMTHPPVEERVAALRGMDAQN